MEEHQLWLCSIFSFSRNPEFNPFSPSGLCLNATSLWVPCRLLTSLSNSSNFYFFMELTVFWHTYILLIYYCLSCTMECKLHGDRVFIVVVFCSFGFDLFFVLFYRLLCSQHLQLCLAQWKHSEHLLNEWMNAFKELTEWLCLRLWKQSEEF